VPGLVGDVLLRAPLGQRPEGEIAEQDVQGDQTQADQNGQLEKEGAQTGKHVGAFGFVCVRIRQKLGAW
jgi:hypothetical protein